MNVGAVGSQLRYIYIYMGAVGSHNTEMYVDVVGSPSSKVYGDSVWSLSL